VDDDGTSAREPGPATSGDTRLSLPITALDLGGDAVFVTDRDGIIVDVNEAFVQVTGYAREEAIGASPRLLSSGLQDDAFYDDLWSTITSGQVWQGELVDRRRDGELRTHHVTITPVRDGTGHITHFVAVERDVSSELARAGASSRAGLVHTDASGWCIYADRGAGALLGMSPEALLGMGLRAALSDEDADALVEVTAMAVERGRDFRLEVRTRGERWLRCEVAPLSVASGSVIGVRCNLEDITPEVATERELARRNALVTSVLDALDEPVAVIGADGIVLTVNLAWREAVEAGTPIVSTLVPGSDARSMVVDAAAGGDAAAITLRDELTDVLTGRARGRRRSEGITVHPLAWEEGGAILRYRRAAG
jgi:PAS domain S-box-containing protein